MSDTKTGDRMFTVYVDRVERYGFPCNVLAGNGEEAADKVKRMDAGDKFADLWNELQPHVETQYCAVPAREYADRGEGPVL